MISVYQLKPRFQNLLRPGVQRLYRRGITANQVTLAACLLSLLVGALVAGFASHLWLFALVPLWMFLRMALNAVDGMLAREFGQKSDLGAYLNELTDVIADSGLYLPFALLPGVNPLWVVLVVLLAVISEYAGALGTMVGASRRYDGPMGKSDRALCFGVIGAGVASGLLPLAWIDWLMLLIAALLLLTIGLFVVALACFFTLGRSFLPPFNEGSFTINISSLPGISLEESDKIGHRAEELLLSIPEIQTVARKTGRAELDEHALGVNVSEIEAPFELKDRSRSELVADVREKLGTITGANIEIGQPISHRIDAMLSGTKANIAIKLFGDDLNKMFSLGNQIKGAISDIPGVADLNVEQQIERPQLKIQPKREMLAKFGITLPEFSEYVNVALAGKVISQVYEQGKSFDLIVKVKDDARDEIEKIRNLMVDTNDGRKVPLSYVAEVVSAMGPNTISRENVKRKIVISANVADRDLRSVVNDIQARVDKDIKLPEGYHLEYGGQFESEQAASRTLLLTSLMSIAVIFLLLYHEFRSVKESAIILINLPLALIGGVFALLMTTGEVSIPAIIGFISLFGIATRNGMLLISHYNHLQQEEGINVYDSVIRGSMDRLNPILMTALSSALALIPLALGGDLPGNEIQSPMAKVILGGLLTSTFLNGFIIPIVYLMMHPKKQPLTISNNETNSHI